MIEAAFPLHEMPVRDRLKNNWVRYSLSGAWQQPLDEVRDYFGEEIALYFTWLGHYVKWLVGPSILGVICGFRQLHLGSTTMVPVGLVLPEIAAFAFFITVWGTLFLEFWKRKESLKKLEWGMLGFEDEEPDRLEFVGLEVRSPIHGKPMTYFSRGEAALRSLFSVSVITLFVSVYCACV